MENLGYWFKLAEQVYTTEEKRYCYTRCIELDEENQEAWYRLKSLGPGPARAPLQIAERIVIISPPTRNEILVDDEDEREEGGQVLIFFAAGAIIIAAIVFLKVAGYIT